MVFSHVWPLRPFGQVQAHTDGIFFRKYDLIFYANGLLLPGKQPCTKNTLQYCLLAGLSKWLSKALIFRFRYGDCIMDPQPDYTSTEDLYLTLVMLNKLRCHTHFYLSAKQIP